MDHNIISLLIASLNTLFLISVLAIFTVPHFFTFLIVLFLWLTTQGIILYYGIVSELLGFILMPIINLVMTLIYIITTAGNKERENSESK